MISSSFEILPNSTRLHPYREAEVDDVGLMVQEEHCPVYLLLPGPVKSYDTSIVSAMTSNSRAPATPPRQCRCLK
ncbi:hypothetical protein KSP40_PGU008402 [Platanthera guangdongensis]|uniref:Uncharacterized protein n=1 Tax=Platanthera guangdongensis TaxID=2320717 RepID=A0ABR2LPA0_9ASPA